MSSGSIGFIVCQRCNPLIGILEGISSHTTTPSISTKIDALMKHNAALVGLSRHHGGVSLAS